MMSSNRTTRLTAPGIVVLAIVTVLAPPAAAQDPAAPETGRATVTAGTDFLNAYAFRGIPQDNTGLIMWPQVSLGLVLYSGSGGLRAIGVNVGTWNSLHSGVAGSDGPSGKRWYESDVRAALNIALAGGVTVGTTYTTYTSPNDMFTTVREMSVGFAVDDRTALGRIVGPYALAAFELDTQPGRGQADGGFDAGKYLEIGAAPDLTVKGVGIAFPVKVGLSLGGYYELAGRDHTFGYFSTSGAVTVPLGGRTKIGALNVHGGVEYQALGKMPKAINGGDGSNVIGSIGVRWSR